MTKEYERGFTDGAYLTGRMAQEEILELKNNSMRKSIKAWCFAYKDTGELEPFSDRNINHKRWQDGYGIFGTKKDLLDNAFEMEEGMITKRINLYFE